jgi:hypothetical protein
VPESGALRGTNWGHHPKLWGHIQSRAHAGGHPIGGMGAARRQPGGPDADSPLRCPFGPVGRPASGRGHAMHFARLAMQFALRELRECGNAPQRTAMHLGGRIKTAGSHCGNCGNCGNWQEVPSAEVRHGSDAPQPAKLPRFSADSGLGLTRNACRPPRCVTVRSYRRASAIASGHRTRISPQIRCFGVDGPAPGQALAY